MWKGELAEDIVGVGERRPRKFSARSAEDDAQLDVFRKGRKRGETRVGQAGVVVGLGQGW